MVGMRNVGALGDFPWGESVPATDRLCQLNSDLNISPRFAENLSAPVRGSSMCGAVPRTPRWFELDGGVLDTDLEVLGHTDLDPVQQVRK